MRLAGKVAVVTGTSPNINGEIAAHLAAEGARLVCVDANARYAAACAAAIRRQGGEALGMACDVSEDRAAQAIVERAQTTYGALDILVNGVAVQVRKGLFDLDVATFRRQWEAMVTGAFLCTKHAARLMIDQGRGGSIINIGSTEGHQGNLDNLGYGVAKGALLHFTRIAAMELAPHGIRVNSLTPTATDPTAGRARAAEWGVEWSPEQVAWRGDFTQGDAGVPLGKRPAPWHYARAAVFLASDDAAMITGIDLRVDGGTIARYWRWNPGAVFQPPG
jgi:NAD(P)-dependent dehydrogenase (short-subunit alcohol dehydrogenase family)